MRVPRYQTNTMLYSVPTLAQRRAELAASMAYFAHVLRTAVPPLEAHQRFPCYQCGQAGPGDWCNTCEVLGNRPLREQPHLVTPFCHACMAANVQCRVCGVRPDDGPDDAAFQVAGVPLGPDGAAIQVAGVLDDM